jgi:hypothetical protein
MSRLEIILSASLLLSVALNIGVIVYARAAILRLLSISEELGDLQNMADMFTTHLNDVYNLEMFYGEPVLANLLDHASSFNEQMQTFEYIYTLTDAVENEDINEDEPTEEENTDDNDTQTT